MTIELELIVQKLRLYVPEIRVGVSYDRALSLILNQFDIFAETINSLNKDNEELLKQLNEKQTVIDRLISKENEK
jgi:hypothetical protein